MKPLYPPNNVDAAIAMSCKEAMTLLGLDGGDKKTVFLGTEPAERNSLVEHVVRPIKSLTSSLSSKLDNIPFKVGSSDLSVDGGCRQVGCNQTERITGPRTIHNF